VPSENRLGLDDYMIMEGMAYRVVETAGKDRVNAEIGFKLFGNPENFRGITDPSVKKDDNDQKLILNYIVAIFQISDDYYRRGMLDSALIAAKLAADLQPQENRLWQIDAFLARVLAAGGRFDEIAAIADRSPEGESIFLAASQDLLKDSDFDKAAILLKMTLDRYPSSIAALNNLAAIYSQLGDKEAFDSVIEKFRSENSDSTRLLATLDQIIERLKKLPPAPSRKP